MHYGLGRVWKQAAVISLLMGVDLAVSLPIMGATYRPFSWMSIAPADAATLYPVLQNPSYEGNEPAIRNLTLHDGKSDLVIEVTAGAHYALQRSTNLLDGTGWMDVSATTAADSLIHMIDTNPAVRAVFYRVKQTLGGVP